MVIRLGLLAIAFAFFDSLMFRKSAVESFKNGRSAKPGMPKTSCQVQKSQKIVSRERNLCGTRWERFICESPLLEGAIDFAVDAALTRRADPHSPFCWKTFSLGGGRRIFNDFSHRLRV